MYSNYKNRKFFYDPFIKSFHLQVRRSYPLAINYYNLPLSEWIWFERCPSSIQFKPPTVSGKLPIKLELTSIDLAIAVPYLRIGKTHKTAGISDKLMGQGVKRGRARICPPMLVVTWAQPLPHLRAARLSLRRASRSASGHVKIACLRERPSPGSFRQSRDREGERASSHLTSVPGVS